MQVGLCTPLKGIDAAKTAGFEYLELGTSEIAALSDVDYESALAQVKQLGLPVPVTNLFLPATLKVTGPEIDRDESGCSRTSGSATLDFGAPIPMTNSVAAP